MVQGLSNQVYVAAGGWHSCSVGADGSVNCWGWNGDGQLGNGTTTNTSLPTRVMASSFQHPNVPLVGAVEVVAGLYHTCARINNGEVWCWGWNGDGELGDGSTTMRTAAVPVVGITNAIQLALGAEHTCALLADHTVRCWGDNDQGELGYGSSLSSSTTPVAVAGLTNVTAVSATWNGGCVRLDDGTMQCWGDADLGATGNGTALGNGFTPIQYTPTPVRNPTNTADLTNVSTISTGGNGTNCAILADGTAYCWGFNADGETGSGIISSWRTGINGLILPTAVGSTNGSPLTAIAMGGYQACGRTADGNYWCWGDNTYGQLGNNTTTGSSVPVYNDIPQWVSPTQRIAAAGRAACVINSACGTVSCWGANESGQLGDGTTTTRSTPAFVSGFAGCPSDVVALAGGGALGGQPVYSGFNNYFCALRADGTVWCWGQNDSGQLGNGSTTDSLVPVQVSGISNAVAIAPGCALLADGTVSCWGYNVDGEVGDGTNQPRTTPVPVQGLSNVTAITGEGSHCALRTDGTVWCWGNNFNGQLGNGSAGAGTNSWTPVQVSQATGLDTAVSITGADGHCALRSDGTAWCWGVNLYGQVGDGTTTDRPTPTRVSGSVGIVGIFATADNTCAIQGDGSLRCWGANLFDQLGINQPNQGDAVVPTPVLNLGNVVEVAMNRHSSYALRADGTLWAWGSNANGELGNNSFTDALVPVQALASP
jgi:alpha-tubulin suppressor-like RCC1 family protein